MKITQFKRMLALYGADVSRWEGVDIDAVKDLIRSSAEARALYQEAGMLDDALDRFRVGAADPVLLDNVMSRIGGEEPALKPVVAPAPPAARAPVPSSGWNMQFYWFGAVACALALLVFVGTLGDQGGNKGGDPSTTIAAAQTAMAPALQPVPQTQVAAASEIDLFLAELGNMVEEDIAEQEIIGLLAMADNGGFAPEPQVTQSSAAMQEEEIDAFIDQLLMEEDPLLQQEMDLWELFLESNPQANQARSGAR